MFFNENFRISKTLVFLFLLGLCSSLYAEQFSYVGVELLRYDPSPAIPGRTLDIYIYIKNSSQTIIRDLVVKLNLENDYGTTYPFELDNQEKEVKSKITLGINETALFEYRVKVDPKASNGVYKVKIEYGEDGRFIRSYDFNITVLNKTPSVEIIEAEPFEASTGEKIDLTLKVKNIGNDTAYDTIIGVDNSNLNNQQNFSPAGSGFVYIGKIMSNEEKIVKYSLIVSPKAEIKTYNIPFIIKYYNSNYVESAKISYVGLALKSRANIECVVNNTTSKLFKGGISEINFDIFNIGSDNAKYVTIEAFSQDATIETPVNFIGTLEPDDFDSFKLKVKPDANSADIIKILIKIMYLDSYDKKIEKTKEFSLKVYEKSEIDKANNINLIVIVLAILLLAVIGKIVIDKMKKR